MISQEKLQQIRKNNMVFIRVKEIALRELKPAVEAVPKELREQRELIEGRYLSAAEFLASVASLFMAYRTLLETDPDEGALIRALGDLSFGFDTNQFYNTFKGFLHPILLTSINSWLDSVDYRAILLSRDNLITRNLAFAGQHMWLELFSATAFCLGGQTLMRDVGSKLKEEIIREL